MVNENSINEYYRAHSARMTCIIRHQNLSNISRLNNLFSQPANQPVHTGFRVLKQISGHDET